MTGPQVRRRLSPDGEASAAARSIGTSLREATESLNEAFANAEATMMQFGVAGQVPVSQRPDGETDCLAFRKSGRAWQLLHVELAADGEEERATALSSAPRWFRVTAAAQLAALVDRLRAAAQAELDQVEAATAAVRRVVADLGPPPADEADAVPADDEDIPF